MTTVTKILAVHTYVSIIVLLVCPIDISRLQQTFDSEPDDEDEDDDDDDDDD